MCSNYGITHSGDEVEAFFAVAGPVTLPAQADFFPKQHIPVVGRKPNSRPALNLTAEQKKVLSDVMAANPPAPVK